MVLVDVDIQAEIDDGYAYLSIENTYSVVSNYDVYPTFSPLSIYNDDMTDPNQIVHWGWLKFTGITVPQGATINDATVTLQTSLSQSSAQNFYLTLFQNNSPITVTTDQTFADYLALTTNVGQVASFTISKSTGAGFSQDTFDVKTIVQELVDNFDFNNQAMMFRIKGAYNIAGTEVDIKGFGAGGSDIPNLTFNYTVGGAIDKTFTVDARLAVRKLFDIDAKLIVTGGFVLDPLTGKITFGVVSDGSNDAISRDIAQEFGVSETFNDDFSSYADQTEADLAWVSSDTPQIRVNVGTDVIDYDWTQSNAIEAISFDLGAGNVSNTSWVLRFKFVLNSFTKVDASPNLPFIGLSDNDGQGANMDGNGIGFQVEVRTAEPVDFNIFHRDDATGSMDLVGDQGTDVVVDVSTGTSYVELIRESSIKAVCNVYSDAQFTNLLGTGEVAMGDLTADLRYILMGGRDNNGMNLLDGTIDDVQFWNATTTPVITSVDWRLRYKVNITNIDNGSTTVDKKLYGGLFDSDETVSSTSNQDGLFVAWKTDSGADDIFINSVDGADPQSEPRDATFATAFTTTDYFVELKRTSSTAYEASLYPDDTYTTPTETETGTITSGITGLKYLKFMNDQITGDGAIDGSIDDIVYTDFEQAEVAPTETFTIDALLDDPDAVDKTFLVDAFVQALGDNGCSTIFADDFANATNWTQTGTQVTITGGEISGWGADASIQRLTHDLVTPLSDDQWTVEFEYEFSAFTLPAHDILVVTDTNGPSSSLQDHISVRFGFTGALIQFGLLHGGNSSIGAGTILGVTASINTRYFVRLQRLSSEVARLTVFTGGFDSVLFGTIDVDLNLFGGIPTGLQFVISETSNLGGAGRSLTGIIDNLSVKGCRTFTVNALLQAEKTETFLVDATLSQAEKTETFLVDAFIQALGDNGCSAIFQDDFSTATNWTEVGSGDVTITGGVIDGWGPGGSSSADNRLTHDLGSTLNDTSWKAEFEYIFTASNLPSHPILYFTDKDQDPDATSDNDEIGVVHGSGVDELKIVYVDNGDIGASGISSSGIPISSSTTYYPRLERLSSTLVRLSVYSDVGRTTHIASSPVTLTVTSTTDGLRYIQSSNPSQGSVIRTLTGTLDNLAIDGGCPTFEVDAILITLTATIDKEFQVDARIVREIKFDIDARIVREIKFDIDAIVRYAQGSDVSNFGAIPDLIIRVLRENGTLTGDQIIDEIVIITTNENFPFRGKTSRIKNWLNRLKLDGLIQEDGSSPDWYRTNWTLV